MMDVSLDYRCACCAQWATTCSRAIDLRKPAAAGSHWTMPAFQLASSAAMFLGSSMLSTVMQYVLLICQLGYKMFIIIILYAVCT